LYEERRKIQMRKKCLAIVVIVSIMAMETMTVFAAEGGSKSPTSKTVIIEKQINPFVGEGEIKSRKIIGMAKKSDLAEKFGLFDEAKYYNE
jgi:hypothetical protein